MLLYKMSDLAAYLHSKNVFSAEQLDYWMENGQVSYAAKRVGKGLLLCRFQYDAVISIERFSKDAALFLAFVCCWLQDFDADREDDDLPMPSIDVTPLDDSTADIEVKITFIEEITALQDQDGPLVLNGVNYKLDDAQINVADSVGVGDNENLATDLVYVRPHQD